MSNKIEYTGSWAENDVVDTFKDNGVLPKNANEAVPIKGTGYF